MAIASNKTDYYFMLMCMAGITAAAVTTAAVYASIAATTATAASSTALLAVGATATVTAMTFSPLLPLFIILCIIGAVCLLPLLICGGHHVATVGVRTHCHGTPGIVLDTGHCHGRSGHGLFDYGYNVHGHGNHHDYSNHHGHNNHGHP